MGVGRCLDFLTHAGDLYLAARLGLFGESEIKPRPAKTKRPTKLSGAGSGAGPKARNKFPQKVQQAAMMVRGQAQRFRSQCRPTIVRSIYTEGSLSRK